MTAYELVLPPTISKNTIKVSSSLGISTVTPGLYQFGLKVSSFGVSLVDKMSVRICGNEVIKLKKDEDMDIKFNQSSRVEVISRSKYVKFFSVVPIECEVQKFQLSYSPTSQAV